MNSTTPKKTQKKTIIISASIVSVILLGSIFYVFGLNGTILGWPNRKHNESAGTNLTPPTKQQVDSGNDVKKQTITKDQSSKPNTATSTATAPQPFTVTVSASGKTDQTFQVRVLIDKLMSDGVCTILLQKDGATITKTAKTQALSSSSTCQGFDIPLSSLSSGTWSYTITVTDSDGTNSAVNGSIAI